MFLYIKNLFLIKYRIIQNASSNGGVRNTTLNAVKNKFPSFPSHLKSKGGKAELIFEYHNEAF